MKLLVAPGVPFLPDALQKAISEVRRHVYLQIYDCQTQEEAFDSLSLFCPDCVVVDGSLKGFTPKAFESFCRRLKDASRGIESCVVYLLTDFANTRLSRTWPSLRQLDRTQLSNNTLRADLLRIAGQPTITNELISQDSATSTWTSTRLGYQWTGKTTLGEDEAIHRIFGEEKFRRLVHNALDLTCVVEEDGFIKYASASAEQILGIYAKDLAGKYVQDLLPGCRRSLITRFFQKSKVKGGLTDLHIPHADGRLVHLEAACNDFQSDPVIRAFVVTARDVSARKQVEEELKYQSRLLNNIREAVIGLTPGLEITFMNAAAEKLYRTRLTEVAGKKWFELFLVDWADPEEELYMYESLRDHGVWRGELTQQAHNGRRLHVEVSVTVHMDNRTEKPGVIIVVRDIKDRKVVETVLHESENRFRHLVSVTSDLVWQTNEQHTLSYISPKVSELLGYNPAQVIGSSFSRFIASGEALLSQAGEGQDTDVEFLLDAHKPFSYVQRPFVNTEGKLRYFEISGLPHFISGNQFTGYQGVIRDVTARVAAEHAIRDSLREKEILIKEIHHRVKNNMQIVSSLLFLQTQFIRDPDMLSRLQESQDRIRSMALVHEKLYQSKDLNRIDFRDYLDTLVSHIANSYRNRLVTTEVTLDEETVLINIDTAIPCGLMVNELVSNAYKHAFVEGVKGHISLHFSLQEGGRARLVVSDNGRGILNTDLQHYEDTSLGMQLVLALCKQLQGTITAARLPKGGSQFVLNIKLHA